jgi:hypothetical protein
MMKTKNNFQMILVASFIAVASCMALQFSHPLKASALSATYPDDTVMNPPDPGHKAYVEVSRVGGGNTLNAPKTTIDVFFKTGGRKNITIIDGKSCGSPPDFQQSAADGSATTNFTLKDLYYVDLSNEDDSNIVGQRDNDGNCGDHTITFTNIRSDAAGVGPQNWFMGNDDNGKYFAIRVVASTYNVGGLVNAFRIKGENCNNPPSCTNTDTNGVYATTPASNSAGGSDHFFAVQCRPGFDCPQRDFNLEFGASCDQKALDANPFITWYDDDWDFLEQNNPNYNLRLQSILKGTSDWSNARNEDLFADGSKINNYFYPGQYMQSTGNNPLSQSDGGSLGSRQSGGWYKIQTKDDGSGDTGWARFTPDKDRKYRLEFNNVSGINGIRFILPWNPMFSLGGLCDENQNNPNGWCSVLSVSNRNPSPGQNVNITVRFANTSNDGQGGPGNDWIVGDVSQHSGVLLNTGQAKVLNRIENKNSPPRDRLGAKLRWPNDYYTDRTFTVTSAGAGQVTYSFDIRRDSANGFIGNPCSTSISWQADIDINAQCDYVYLWNPARVQYHMSIVDNETGAVVFDSAFLGGPATYGQPVDAPWDTYNVFYPHILPHKSYTFNVYNWGTNILLDSSVLNACITPSCQAQIVPTSTNVTEPGEQFTGTYGITVSNATRRAFTEYNVKVSADPGLYILGPTTAPTISMPPSPPPTNLTGTWLLRSDYTGAIHADITFNGEVIDRYFGGLPCSAPYVPLTRPAIKTTEGDISAGGGFKYLQSDGSLQCSPTAGHYFAPVTSSYDASSGYDSTVGGIRTFASSPPYISSSEFAAYALGWIDSPGGATNGTKYGFYSNGHNSSGFNRLSFANSFTSPNLSGNIGGLLGGQFINAHCAPDYYDTVDYSLDRTPVDYGDGQTVPVNTLSSGQYHFTNSSGHGVRIGIDPSAPALPNGRNVTIFVSGDVLITSNIQYGPWSFDMADHSNNSPYLVIIAKGNIFVDKSVHRLDGVYIAQPHNDGFAGEFSTCTIVNGDGSLSLPDSTRISQNCSSKISINGAVIAQRVRLLRADGTLADNSSTAAENFNFVPSTVLGLPNFKSDNGAVLNNTLNSLYSLPPIF